MSRQRPVPPQRSLLLLAARLGVIGLAVVASGCAARQAAHEPPARVAGPPGPPPGMWKVDIEEDGLPTQLGPRTPRPLPDDPREPWSPNYGKSAPERAAAPAPVGPPQAPARVSQMDEDAIIRQAIAEHEMRRQH